MCASPCNDSDKISVRGIKLEQCNDICGTLDSSLEPRCNRLSIQPARSIELGIYLMVAPLAEAERYVVLLLSRPFEVALSMVDTLLI